MNNEIFNEFIDIAKSIMVIEQKEIEDASKLVREIIVYNNKDTKTISYVFDKMLSIAFASEEDIKDIYYKLLNYVKNFNPELSKDYELIFIEQFKDIEDSSCCSMDYTKLLEILLSDDVYNKIKQNEQQIFELIPELKSCKGFEQNNKGHIYDVYEHILHVVKGVDNNICLRLSALFHDIGKPLTYKEDNNGVGHFYNHWNKSIDIFKKYHDKFKLSNEEISLIEKLIFYHDINIDRMTEIELNNMLKEIGISNIELLFSLKTADLLAQSPEYHNLLSNIKTQKNIIKTKKYCKELNIAQNKE